MKLKKEEEVPVQVTDQEPVYVNVRQRTVISYQLVCENCVIIFFFISTLTCFDVWNGLQEDPHGSNGLLTFFFKCC